MRNVNEYFKESNKDNSSHSSTNIPNQNLTNDLNYQQSMNNQNVQNLINTQSQQINSSSNLSDSMNNSSSNGLFHNQISQHHMSNHAPTINLPEFPNVKELRLRFKTHYKNKHLLSLYSTFLMMYRTHCQRILDTLIRCNLSELNAFISYFWQAVPEHLKCVLTQPVFHCLIAICDCILYKCMTQILSAPLLQSNLPEK